MSPISIFFLMASAISIVILFVVLYLLPISQRRTKSMLACDIDVVGIVTEISRKMNEMFDKAEASSEEDLTAIFDECEKIAVDLSIRLSKSDHRIIKIESEQVKSLVKQVSIMRESYKEGYITNDFDYRKLFTLSCTPIIELDNHRRNIKEE